MIEIVINLVNREIILLVLFKTKKQQQKRQ
jgi:hypothetical protein